jgi:hypothetical protein
MGLSITFKYFALLFLVISTVFSAQANVNPRNTSKTNTEQKVNEEQIPEQEQVQANEKEEVVEGNETLEGSESNKPNSSLNYFFYMIIKVKFENLFKFPDRNSPQSSTGINLINMNHLGGYFDQARI